MWPFTGGCSYAGDCDRYTQRCRQCPQLKRAGANDLSARTFRRKLRVFKDLDLTVVTPSAWMADRARVSRLLGDHPIEVIPNGLDLDVYKPMGRETGRIAWNLPQDVPIVTFGAVRATRDLRKGFDLLHDAISALRDRLKQEVQLIVFGASEPADGPAFPFPVTYVGNVSDDVSLSLLYSASDVTVLPSRQDNLPNVAVESLACGTPVAAFATGGIQEIVDHQKTGVLAPPESPEDLADGIQWILEQGAGSDMLRRAARAAAAERFSLDSCALRYRDLYQQVLDRRGQSAGATNSGLHDRTSQ
jgi:glycosyltransferase involved in cell wall biosynthesis